MKTRFLIIVLSCLSLFAAPARVSASSSDDSESKSYDARLEGYASKVTVDSSSTALTWLLVIILGGICVAVMFMNPKRSHLD